MHFVLRSSLQGDFFLKLMSTLETVEMKRVMTMLWSVWRSRNELIWDATASSSARTIGVAFYFLKDWQEVRVPEPKRRDRPWHAPSHGYVKG